MRKIGTILIGIGILWAVITLLTGCVKTTRFVLDKEGNVTERIETLEPSVVTMYGGPVVYTGGQYYDQYGPVGYVEPCYRPVRHVRTVYVGGHSHHHRR